MKPAEVCCNLFMFVNRIEPQILDYQTQQMKLFPAICTAYALHFSGAALQSAYNDILASVGNGDMSRLSEVCVIQELC